MNNMINMLTQLKNNPVGLLSQRYNLPQGMNNPNDILQHLLNTGQVKQEQVNALMSNAQQLSNLLSLRAL